jgi:hypothetical protein
MTRAILPNALIVTILLLPIAAFSISATDPLGAQSPTGGMVNEDEYKGSTPIRTGAGDREAINFLVRRQLAETAMQTERLDDQQRMARRRARSIGRYSRVSQPLNGTEHAQQTPGRPCRGRVGLHRVGWDQP